MLDGTNTEKKTIKRIRNQTRVNGIIFGIKKIKLGSGHLARREGGSWSRRFATLKTNTQEEIMTTAAGNTEDDLSRLYVTLNWARFGLESYGRITKEAFAQQWVGKC